MVTITKKELGIDNELKNKIEFICSFCNTTPTIINGNIRKINKTNLDYFKELWRKFIKFLQDKFFSSNKYDEIINDLYDEDIIDDNELDIIQNNKNIDKSDDFER